MAERTALLERAQAVAPPQSLARLLRGLVRTARPRQWVKNVLVVAAPAAAVRLFTPHAFGRLALVFTLFTACAAAVYLINDARDAAADRAHPVKRHRPVAAGQVPVPAAYAVGGTLGVLAYAADLGLFVRLRGPAGLDPLTAKALSFLAGCSVAHAGNAHGTYRHTAARGPRPYLVFLAVNAAGALVQLLCIAVSHYGLGFTSPRADTVSGAGIGMALATVLRFRGTRALVFRGEGGVGSWTG